jgi:hypothetical protein
MTSGVKMCGCWGTARAQPRRWWEAEFTRSILEAEEEERPEFPVGIKTSVFKNLLRFDLLWKNQRDDGK